MVAFSLDLKTLMERFFLVNDSKYNGVKFYLDRFQRNEAEKKVDTI